MRRAPSVWSGPGNERGSLQTCRVGTESVVARSRCPCDRSGSVHRALSRTLVQIPSGPLSLRGMGMKPAPFDYQAPATLREAVSLLGSHPEAAVIAGGQSLMPILAFRLATPSLLVDLRRIQERDY